MNRVYIWGDDVSVITLSIKLTQADPRIIVNVYEDSHDNMYFDTRATKEQLIAAAKIALSDINIRLTMGKEKIFDNYVCEDCGTKDENNHSSRCETNYEYRPYTCYCHDDEI